jgi:alpha-N-arabinofuranosidase
MMRKIVLSIIVLASIILPLPLKAQDKNLVILNADMAKDTISRHIYGNFSEHLGHCIYGGIWVGENSTIPNTRGIRNDVVAALKNISIPNLRWPGGCFADEYHWMDGIGPRANRPKMVNTHWGGVVEDNSFGTHEFLDFCEQVGTEPYICGNLGSGSVEEMSKWVEYMTFDGQSPMAEMRRKNGRDKPWKVSFWGVGNENWGCGGNMTAEFYADQYKRYATYCRNYGNNHLFKVAGGPTTNDYHWTETLMKNISGNMMGGISLHYYTIANGWDNKGSATDFTEKDYFATLKSTLYMEELVTRHSSIMDQYDPQKKVALVVDEWGTWYDVEPGTNPGFLFQQNSMRDAMVAAINLNIFNNHCDRVRGANIAQMVNVLQSIIFTEGDKMVLTPTYYIFEMYKVHQQAALIPLSFKSPEYIFDGKSIPAVTASASRDKKGIIHVTFTQADPHNEVEVNLDMRGLQIGSVKGRILTAKELNAHNSFDKPDVVKTADFTAAKLNKNRLTIKLPPVSVVMLELN